MIPIHGSKIFKSRWKALFWAAGVIWFAYDVAESQPHATTDANSAAEAATDATGAAVTSDDQNRLADAINSF
ncbi:MAG: hypothetical protein ABIW33_03525 [Sphingomicrobium sp.]